MAAGDFTLFQEFVDQIGEEQHNFASDTLKLGLIDDTLAPVASMATPTWGDYSANEVDEFVGGYSEGGVTLSGVQWNHSGSTNTLDDTGNISLTQNASGFDDARWGILYNSTNGTNMAIGFLDLGGDVSQIAGAITINWGASGILTVAIS